VGSGWGQGGVRVGSGWSRGGVGCGRRRAWLRRYAVQLAPVAHLVRVRARARARARAKVGSRLELELVSGYEGSGAEQPH